MASMETRLDSPIIHLVGLGRSVGRPFIVQGETNSVIYRQMYTESGSTWGPFHTSATQPWLESTRGKSTVAPG